MLSDLQGVFQPLTGRKVVIMSSTDARHEAGAYQWYNPKGKTGGAFTNAFLDAFNARSAGGATVSLPRAFDDANTAVASTAFTREIRVQNPQYWERTLAPGETCVVLASPSPTSTSTPTAPPTPAPTTPPPTPTLRVIICGLPGGPTCAPRR